MILKVFEITERLRICDSRFVGGREAGDNLFRLTRHANTLICAINRSEILKKCRQRTTAKSFQQFLKQ